MLWRRRRLQLSQDTVTSGIFYFQMTLQVYQHILKISSIGIISTLLKKTMTKMAKTDFNFNFSLILKFWYLGRLDWSNNIVLIIFCAESKSYSDVFLSRLYDTRLSQRRPVQELIWEDEVLTATSGTGHSEQVNNTLSYLFRFKSL
jgi:hypothetical protein